jgi:drug/metabolite transporter (DMT)-like permease
LPLQRRTDSPPTRGILYAIAAAVLFGASTPLSRLLLSRVTPALLAALLYLGAGVGLALSLGLARRGAGLVRSDARWLAGATLFGGVLGPLALLYGLRATPAGVASLLLNLESVFTAFVAWRVFGEQIDRRLAAGMGLVLVASSVLAWPGQVHGAPTITGPVAIAIACLCWAIDNNFTRKVSDADPRLVVAVKCSVAGAVNLAIALALGARWPGGTMVAVSLFVGLLSYGVSLLCFVLALRHLGAARTGSWFSAAPFIGAGLSLFVAREPLTVALVVASALMGIALYLHGTEKHEHSHEHPPTRHRHGHRHDDGHHRHEHAEGIAVFEGHEHEHEHERVVHAHAHFPDTHHQHEHEPSDASG